MSFDKHNLLSIEHLKVHFHLNEGLLEAVNDVSFSINEQETLGIIGESGCGKSVTAQSVLRIIPKPGEIKSGKIKLKVNSNEIDLVNLNPKSRLMRSIRGKQVSMIFQEPMTSLSPVHTIGNQVEESILLHTSLDKNQARDLAVEMLQKVGISNAQQRINDYPHELSGGMRQRVMIGMALCCKPKLLIADEPTTALDVTVQAQILKLLSDFKNTEHMSMLYISHDLGVIADIADKIAVMYLGRVVEITSKEKLFTEPLHPYSQLLIESIPQLGASRHKKLSTIEGNVPTPLNLKKECGFFSRCPKRIDGLCNHHVPDLMEIKPLHDVRCFLYE
jgi:oligopeptide/dipeptide ABC transporter ATP-binding protein